MSGDGHDFAKPAFCADPTFTAFAETERWSPRSAGPGAAGAWGGFGGGGGLRAKDA